MGELAFHSLLHLIEFLVAVLFGYLAGRSLEKGNFPLMGAYVVTALATLLLALKPF